MSIRILIADDHGVVRSGLAALLANQSDFEIVGEAEDGNETLKMAGEVCPDVVLLDISMPGPSGIEVTRRLKRALPGARVLILTVHEDGTLMREALQSGASGYILKRATKAELAAAIRTVCQGALYIHGAMMPSLFQEIASVPAPPDPAQEPLTPREIDILRLVGQGYTNRQIAEQLALSLRTVESHRANLMTKLGAKSRVDLVHYAAAHKLID